MSKNYINKVQLKNGKQVILRVPLETDAQNIIDYLNTVGGESENLLFGANEFTISVEQEIGIINNINKDENSLMVLGVIDDKIVSVAQITSPYRKRIEHNSEIAISIKKEYWGIGVGSAMLTELINFAKNHGVIKNVSLRVREDNYNAIKLYKKHGFEKVGIHKNYFNVNGEYCNGLLMDLYL